MYKIGETFVYGASGVCSITDIKEEKFSDKEMKYYVLEPKGDHRSTIFIPVDNEKLVSKLKRVLTKDEVKSLISSIPEIESVWVDNVNLRREKFKEIINSSDRTKLVSLVKTLKKHEEDQIAAGKKLSVYDEKFYRQALNIVDGEFALVLGIEPDEVGNFISTHLKQTA